jgi:RNA methyltransferase, TrmH family
MDKLSLAKERELTAISARHGRRKTGKTIVEGVRAIGAMLDSGVIPDYVVVSPRNLTIEGEEFLRGLADRDLTIFECDTRRFAKLSDTVNSQGFLAAIKTDLRQADDRALTNARFVLYLDGISDPGNVGTILRTAAAFAVDLVTASSTTVDFYNPKVIRASAGMVFRLRLLPVSDPKRFFDRLSANDIELLGSAPEATTTLETTTLAGKVCLAIGSEATGLSPIARQASQRLFRIRTVDGVESLNAAAAAAIAIHQIATKLELV